MVCVRRRGKVYCAVLSVPVDLQLLIRKRQIWRSLKTKNYIIARSQSRKLLLGAEQLFHKVRSTCMDSRLINAMVADFGLDLLKMNDEFRLGTAVDAEFINAVYASASRTPDGRDFLAENAKKMSDKIQEAIFTNSHDSLSFMNNVVETLLDKYGVNIKSVDSTEKREVVAALAQTAKLAYIIEKERVQGIRDESDRQYRIISRWENDKTTPKDKGIPLRELLDKYLEEWSVKDVARRRRKTAELKRIEFSFKECFGKLCGVKEIDQEMAEEWQCYIQYEYSSKIMTNKAINNYNETLSAIFNFGLASKKKYVDIQPFRGLTLPVGKASERSRIFENDELTTYVNLLIDLYLPENPETTWLPLIMMFSGMRCNEIAQLFLDNIQFRDEIYFFRIVDNEDRHQKVKSDSSSREVPIHQTLIDFGLLEYVEKMKRAGHKQLFSNCIYRENVGLHYDSALSSLLNAPINLIDDDKKLRLYSLRANFRCSIEEKFINRAIAALDAGESSDNTGYSRYYDLALNDIMGHAVKGTVGDMVYRKRRLYIANAVLQLAEYPTVDFSDLKKVINEQSHPLR
jgi:integrase